MLRIIKLGCIILFASLLISSCASSFNSTHYIEAYDRKHKHSNFYKVDMTGTINFSSAKFSSGLYDRYSTNKLFGEMAIEREYLAQKIARYDQDGNAITDLAARLTAATTAGKQYQTHHLEQLGNSIAEEIGKMEVLLELQDNKGGNKLTLLKQAEAKLTTGKKELTKTTGSNSVLAAIDFRQALGILSALRVAMGTENTVMFFDPDGNELDVVNKSFLVFVSTDSSAFTNAISTIANNTDNTRNLINTLLAPKLVQQERLNKEIEGSNQDNKVIVKLLNEKIQNITTAESLKTIGDMAKPVAEKIEAFTDADEIRAYARGMGGVK